MGIGAPQDLGRFRVIRVIRGLNPNLPPLTYLRPPEADETEERVG